MAPSRKSRREKSRAPETPTTWKLPMDVLLEIIARSNYRTIIRCAATCRLLRRDILSPPLDRRIAQASPCILGFLCYDAKKPLDLIHLTTGGALSFCHHHLPRFMSRKTVALLGKYRPVSSRHGIVVLRRIKFQTRSETDQRLDMCVHDPMSGLQTFFSDPPEIRGNNQHSDHKYVMLTAADGIDDSTLLLLAFDPHGCNIKARSISLCGTTWEHVRYVSNHEFPWGSLKNRSDPTILNGGILHWLPSRGKQILSFDLGTRKTGSVKLSPTNCNVDHYGNNLYLATSSDGKLLKLLAIQGFVMFVWIQHPVSAPGDSGWSLETVIDMEEELRSLDPRITDGPNKHIVFEGSGKRTGEVVFLSKGYRRDNGLIVFDLETKKMQYQNQGLSLLLEIDLLSRLQTMKIFS